MRAKWPAVLALLGFGLSAAAPAAAHHAFNQVARDKEMSLFGTVEEFRWTEPHGWLRVAVQDPDATINGWSLETPPPTVLARRGWSRTSLMPGQKVVIKFHPFKDGGRAGALISVTLPDGRVLSVN